MNKYGTDRIIRTRPLPLPIASMRRDTTLRASVAGLKATFLITAGAPVPAVHANCRSARPDACTGRRRKLPDWEILFLKSRG
jgi:hypothetical protein